MKLYISLFITLFFNFNHCLGSINVNFSKKEHCFEENKGQIKNIDENDTTKVLYFCRNKSLIFYLLKNGISYQFNKIDSNSSNTPNPTLETYRIDMNLIGMNQDASIEEIGEIENYNNYYNSAEILNVKSYKKIIYHNIYPNIDWCIYFDSFGLKYDFIFKT